LLVEDEEAVANLVSALLRRQGHEITLASNGLDGWERLSATPDAFDAVIMDLNMPGLSGQELARRARVWRTTGQWSQSAAGSLTTNGRGWRASRSQPCCRSRSP